MTTTMKRIGILTGGGDCPGLNAAIRGLGKSALYKGIEVVGIQDGYQGLIENRTTHLGINELSGILTRGGTILGTNNKCSPEKYYEGRNDSGEPIYSNAVDRCMANAEEHELDVLFVIGGDGTFTCTKPLVEAGLPCIGVPKTIDNDIHGTDLTIGFTTATRIGTMALDRLHSTGDSHHRVMVCELMGRNSGWLTLASGLASGSDVILIPEIPFDIETVCKFVDGRKNEQSGFSIIACSEGAHEINGTQVVSKHIDNSPDPIRLGGIGQQVAHEIEKRTGIETRTTTLGHIQRGGEPAATDRVVATTFATAAFELAIEGQFNKMVALSDGHMEAKEILDAAGKQRLVPKDHRFIRAARAVRTCFGD
ncbi:MAG: 6-phosphofructokinase [Planctomycetes bacterium]|nr:6-phosphofructokinase [Planctomycetota bacterium]MBL6997030.1 6-phosphofructokinase [Phycisphaerales bacterium]